MGFDVESELLAKVALRSEVASPRPSGVAGDCPDQGVQPRGFGPMARISTAMGEVYAQTLRKGDRVRTRDGGFRPIVDVKRILLDEDFLHHHPGAQPVLLRAGAFARNVPAVDTLLAPGQKIHKRQAVMAPVCDTASDALHKPGVIRKNEPMITYTVIHCGAPTAVCCEGLWVDTAP